MNKLLSVLLVVAASSALTSSGATLIQLDFGSSTSPVTSGYTQVVGNFLADTPLASVSNINGFGFNFSIAHVGVFTNDSAANPLTTDGFYTFGNNGNDHTFTLSGLTPGSQVSLYAVSAWDGNGRGAQVTFGGSTTQAQVLGTPGTSPTLANFTLINSAPAIADGTGTVTGAILGAGYPGDPTSEGQVGGMVFSITAPEPSSALALAMGTALLLPLRRRR